MNVEMVLQVPVSLILVTCSVTWGLSNHHDEDTGEDEDDDDEEEEDDDEDDEDGDDDDAGDANHSLPLGYAQMKLAFGCTSAILGNKIFDVNEKLMTSCRFIINIPIFLNMSLKSEKIDAFSKSFCQAGQIFTSDLNCCKFCSTLISSSTCEL